MRILLVNPNTTAAMTEGMMCVARTVAPLGADVVPLTAERGFPYIATRAEAQIAGAIALEMIAAHAGSADAAIIAAFGDPGLPAAREIFDFPVVGMAQAALVSAAMLGDRIAIATFSPALRRWYEDAARNAGLGDRFVGVSAPASHAAPPPAGAPATRQLLAGLCHRAVDELRADVVVLGGAPLAGLAAELQPEVGALLVDPVGAAIAQAVALVSMTPRAGFARRSGRPLPKPTNGLSPSLARLFAQEAAE
ncbi:aspartate/glutamate racemase family protein [Acuticoccus sp. MNP-M23]|uniref:aspartate/glutamate racemase family protein n=1 Tax=Acuticoccus sp. MNP-M23 TaxID=3072793 RepID=UPI002815D19E|nr:aspartate/glutamate racemase family protein [Acuticoccus sp. MNP-M23]WMS44523.1 aspartate/glutamate racemase family protein [Acuticoccus sp. MNP-M23]